MDGRTKSIVRAETAKAVRDGLIVAKDKCEHCGRERTRGASGRILAHHPDYSKPLEVIWLCYTCHRKEHNRLKKLKLDTFATQRGEYDTNHNLVHGRVKPCRMFDISNFMHWQSQHVTKGLRVKTGTLIGRCLNEHLKDTINAVINEHIARQSKIVATAE